MLRRHSVNFALFSMVLDALLVGLALRLAVLIRPLLAWLPASQWAVHEVRMPAVLYGIVPLLWLTVFLLSSVYDPQRVLRAVDEFQRVSAGTALAGLALAGLLYFSYRDVSRWAILLFIAIAWSLLLMWRIIARLIWRFGKPSTNWLRRVLVIGAGPVGLQVGKQVQDHAWTGLELVGYLDDDNSKAQAGVPVLGPLTAARAIVGTEQVDEVIIALPTRAFDKLNQIARELMDAPVHVRVVPDYFAQTLYRMRAEDFAGIPMIDLRAPALNDVQRLTKRVFDLTVGSILTICALPVMGLVALAIKLDSPGPVLFRQQRIGENGKPFIMLKFRSMVAHAEEMQELVNTVDEQGHLIHKRPDDPRVTRVGRFIRRFSLDELPQLFNVLKGNMSLVGPRPELPWLVEQYEPWQRKRLAVLPGCTGWWQVNGRSERMLHLHTEEDLYYLQHYSLWLDIKILLKTPWAMLRGKGAF